MRDPGRVEATWMLENSWRKLNERKKQRERSDRRVQFLASYAEVFHRNHSDGGLRVGQFLEPGPRSPVIGRWGPWENVGLENPKSQPNATPWQGVLATHISVHFDGLLILSIGRAAGKIFRSRLWQHSASRRPPTPPPQPVSYPSDRSPHHHCLALLVRDFSLASA